MLLETALADDELEATELDEALLLELFTELLDDFLLELEATFVLEIELSFDEAAELSEAAELDETLLLEVVQMTGKSKSLVPVSRLTKFCHLLFMPAGAFCITAEK